MEDTFRFFQDLEMRWRTNWIKPFFALGQLLMFASRVNCVSWMQQSCSSINPVFRGFEVVEEDAEPWRTPLWASSFTTEGTPGLAGGKQQARESGAPGCRCSTSLLESTLGELNRVWA